MSFSCWSMRPSKVCAACGRPLGTKHNDSCYRRGIVTEASVDEVKAANEVEAVGEVNVSKQEDDVKKTEAASRPARELEPERLSGFITPGKNW